MCKREGERGDGRRRPPHFWKIGRLPAGLPAQVSLVALLLRLVQQTQQGVVIHLYQSGNQLVLVVHTSVNAVDHITLYEPMMGEERTSKQSL